MPAIELYNTPLFNDPYLEGYYRFSNNVNDSSSNGRNLTVVGSANYTTGVFGNAYTQNNSTSNRLYTTNSMDINGGSATLGVWVKNVNTPDDTFSGFVQQKNTNTWTSFDIGRWRDNKLYAGRGKIGSGSDGFRLDWNTYTSTTTFKFYVLTYDGNYVNFYVDGVSVGSPVASSGNGDSYDGSTTGFRVGWSEGWDGHVYPANAIYDEVFVFSRALTADEIYKLYTGNWANNQFFFFNAI